MTAELLILTGVAAVVSTWALLSKRCKGCGHRRVDHSGVFSRGRCVGRYQVSVDSVLKSDVPNEQAVTLLIYGEPCGCEVYR